MFVLFSCIYIIFIQSDVYVFIYYLYLMIWTAGYNLLSRYTLYALTFLIGLKTMQVKHLAEQ